MGLTTPYRQHNYLGEYASDAAALAFVQANEWDDVGDGSGNPRDGMWYYQTVDNKFRVYLKGAWSDGVVKNNHSASSDPTVNDDDADGYAIGSVWINTTTDVAFVCAHASTGAAVWVQSSISLTSPGPHLFSVDPGTLGRSGTAGEVLMDGYHASDFGKNVTDYGAHSRYWFRSPSTTVELKVLFALKADASASNYVRIAARVKSQGTSGSTTAAWQATSYDAVDVSSGSAGDIYEGTVTLSPAVFTAGDAVTINVGRDGSNSLGGGSPNQDNYNKSVRLIAIRGKVD
jgi:hypothetical protein